MEGKVIGDWVTELNRVWIALLPSLGAKQLRIDICGVTYFDDQGRKLLREIFQTTGADILADSPLTKQFADEAKQ